MTDAARPTIDVAERRARLARRHRLVPGCRAADPVDAATALVALHGTDPGTVYLSTWARVDGFAVADLDAALYHERTLVKHMAMRRTLWVLPRAVLPAAQAAASARVAATERKRLAAEVEKAGIQRDGARWLDDACTQVLAALADGRARSSTELRTELPVLEGAISYGEGKPWAGKMSLGPRVLTVLSAEGLIVRSTNDGGWSVSRPRWASMRSWLGAEIEPPPAEDGTAELVERWLRAFGPGTEADIKWWLGSTLTAVRRALADIGAVAVTLPGDDGDAVGWVLADDVDPVEPVDPWVALLPPLDPTSMGWTGRAWYLGGYKADIFDTAGNAGPTMWADGRIVGGWRQRDDASVELQPLERLPRATTKAFAARADELTAWFDGVRSMMRFPSPLSRRLS
jgi:hypothetical protein